MSSKLDSMSAGMPTWRMERKKTREPRLQHVRIRVWDPVVLVGTTRTLQAQSARAAAAIADAGPLSSPRSRGDSTSSNTAVSRTGPVCDPWMPAPSEIQSRFGSTAPPSQYALYSCSGINDDDATNELDFDPATDQRRDYYIERFHELRWYGNKKTSRTSRVPEWQARCQSWGDFVDNFNKDPAGYHERVCLARERYERFSKRPKIDRMHWGAVEAGIPRAVPMGIACEHWHVGVVRVSERDINGYTGVRGPEEPKTLRANLIAQMSWSAAGEHSSLPRAVSDYSSRSSFTPFGGFGGGGLRTPSPFPERPASGRPAVPTYRGSEEILSNKYENDPDLGFGPDDQQFAGRSSEFPPVCLAVGAAAGRRRGSGPPDPVDRLKAVAPPDGRVCCVEAGAGLVESPARAGRADRFERAGRPWVEAGCLTNARWRARAGVGAKSPRLGDSCCA
ncbi:unnamed protein product [Phytophthora fragariaefolia]|uniref:Unnamed protein product n=1 Tax=Phytophthora fragariaefolia TaxID=1490495 RepID=A0A9W6U599_9STRA|nr:unnamed protein product [Phytophthora fragariaefolia]